MCIHTVYACIGIYVYVYIYIYICAHTHIYHIYIILCMSMYAYICMHIYIYIYTHMYKHVDVTHTYIWSEDSSPDPPMVGANEVRRVAPRSAASDRERRSRAGDLSLCGLSPRQEV